jgi:hypothetical protein
MKHKETPAQLVTLQEHYGAGLAFIMFLPAASFSLTTQSELATRSSLHHRPSASALSLPQQPAKRVQPRSSTYFLDRIG